MGAAKIGVELEQTLTGGCSLGSMAGRPQPADLGEPQLVVVRVDLQTRREHLGGAFDERAVALIQAVDETIEAVGQPGREALHRRRERRVEP